MSVLGKETVVAMASVEAQQQRLTLQRLISMAEPKPSHHHRVLQILDQLVEEMSSESQRIEAAPSPIVEEEMPPPPSYEEVNNNVFTSPSFEGETDTVDYFLEEVMFTYRVVSYVELNLSVGDYVVVRKVSNNGWAEGECNGRAGWFPFGKQDDDG